MMRGMFYRLLMRIAHKYHWHYAPPTYPDGDTQLWCQWCGFRQTINDSLKELIAARPQNAELRAALWRCVEVLKRLSSEGKYPPEFLQENGGDGFMFALKALGYNSFVEAEAALAEGEGGK